MTLAEQLHEAGKQETTKEIAIKLLAEGSDIAFVDKITDLSIKDILKI